MGDDEYRAGADWWEKYTLEKIGDVLFAQELYQEDRNGSYTMVGVWGVVWLVAGIWRYISEAQAGRFDGFAAFGTVAGVALVVAGIALRINGQIELRRTRRLIKIVNQGRIPD